MAAGLAYRVEGIIVPIILVTTAILVLSFITIAVQSTVAAILNPMKSLNSE